MVGNANASPCPKTQTDRQTRMRLLLLWVPPTLPHTHTHTRSQRSFQQSFNGNLTPRVVSDAGLKRLAHGRYLCSEKFNGLVQNGAQRDRASRPTPVTHFLFLTVGLFCSDIVSWSDAIKTDWAGILAVCRFLSSASSFLFFLVCHRRCCRGGALLRSRSMH